MKSRLTENTRRYVDKRIRRFLACFLILILIFSLAGCGNQQAKGEGYFEVERGPDSPSMQMAGEATNLAVRQYIYARLATERFMSLDAKAMTMEDLQKEANELLLVWETAEILATGAEKISNQAVAVIESASIETSSYFGSVSSGVMNFIKKAFDLSGVAYGEAVKREFDPQTWAENLSKQYDAIRGAQRYKQLAEQLGTDAKSAYKQMELASKIIQSAAALEEAEGTVNAWTDSINYLKGVKTTSKVGLFVTSAVATGGGSLAALSTSTMTLGQAGAAVVGGVDCLVDISDTSSNIILGENHKVTVAIGDVKDKLAPITSIVGLITFEPSKFGSINEKTGEQLAYIGDTLVDLFYEGKVMGLKVSSKGKGVVAVEGQPIDVSGMDEAAVLNALKDAGLDISEKDIKSIDEVMEDYELKSDESVAKLQKLMAEMDEIEKAAEELQAEKYKDASISGTYFFTGLGVDGEETGEIIIRDNGDGTLLWTGPDDELTLSYNKATGEIVEEGLYIKFKISGEKITATGTIEFWDAVIPLELIKISD